MIQLFSKLFVLVCLLLQSCFAAGTPASTAKPITHEAWTALLKKHVSPAGWVNYSGFAADRPQLTAYLNTLAANPPAADWTKNEQLAYWINAYNAFTIDLILQHGSAKKPLKSIKNIGPGLNIPFVSSPWDIPFIRLGDKTYDLNNIEHGIIRKRFQEPRIHFALVCAAVSCPPLRNEAYEAARLDAQLHEQGLRFFNDATKNEITPNAIKLSKIMDWYGGDFAGSKIDWINRYANVKIRPNARLSYLPYNWALNGKW